MRFLGVLGPSGSGKSSVVLAGLVAWLKEGAIEGSARWKFAILRPGDDPLQSLARRGDRASTAPPGCRTSPDPPAGRREQELADDSRADAGRLDVFAETALHKSPPETRLVVVVDQFEEIFTYRPQDDQARARFDRARAASSPISCTRRPRRAAGWRWC